MTSPEHFCSVNLTRLEVTQVARLVLYVTVLYVELIKLVLNHQRDQRAI